MTELASTVSMWGTLVPVMVGGAIGLIGGWLGPWLVERRKEATEKKKKRAEKFEELVATLFDYEHWLDVIKDMELYSKVDELLPTPPPSPFGKLHAVSAVHFPEFERRILELEAAGNVYLSWMFEARRKHVHAEKDHTAGFIDAHKAFTAVSRTLLTELRSYAKSEFQ